MSTSHHLTDETLLDYAAGSLTDAMETLVACHLTVCARCRQKAQLVEAVGGVQLIGGDSRPMRASARSVLARADAHEPAPGATAIAARSGRAVASQGVASHGQVPRPLQRLLPVPLDELPWRRIAPGIKQFNLSDEPRRNGAFKLLHLAPGVVLSGHTHNERELTYLVQGSYQDEIGRFRAGDIADLDGEVVHQPVVDTDEPCIALIATDSPVRYTGVFGRLVQPFVGI